VDKVNIPGLDDARVQDVAKDIHMRNFGLWTSRCTIRDAWGVSYGQNSSLINPSTDSEVNKAKYPGANCARDRKTLLSTCRHTTISIMDISVDDVEGWIFLHG
jgi:hypothetical protein